MTSHPARSGVLAAILLTAGLLAGCASADDGADGDPAPSASTTAEEPTPSATASEEPTPSETPAEGVTVEISIDGHEVSPSGKTVQAKVGEPVTFVIDATAAGELHVHSTPEQVVSYQAGTSTHQLTFDMPGVVEVESHDAHKVIVQLEVR